MRKSRFSEEQIIQAIKQVEGGVAIAEVCREMGVSDSTFHRWRAKYGGLEVSDAKRLRALETENSRLKKLLGELTLDNRMLKEALGKKW